MEEKRNKKEKKTDSDLSLETGGGRDTQDRFEAIYCFVASGNRQTSVLPTVKTAT